jgi:hypothetical protein
MNCVKVVRLDHVEEYFILIVVKLSIWTMLKSIHLDRSEVVHLDHGNIDIL